MITRRELVRALQRRNIAHWIVIERAQELAVVDERRAIRRTENRTRMTLVIHHDVTHGRGSTRMSVTASDGNALALVDQAVDLAVASVGPAWKTIPPAAPAQVQLLDGELGKDLGEAAAAIVRGLKRSDGIGVLASASVMREQVTIQAKSGFNDDWLASEFRVEALITAGDRSLELMRETRRQADLGLEPAITAAAADLRELAGAGPPLAGRCNLVLSTEALLHGDGLGVWQVFATQADSVFERQGLARYRLQTPIAPGAEAAAEPLAITSDGAIDFAIRSAPVGDEGDAIRRFPIIERGICVGFGLSMREAALRRLDPNGGVCNLVVAPGTWSGSPSGERTIEVRRLRALSIDPVTGDASLELGLAIDHRDGSAKRFTGGTVRLDLVAALAHARRSSKMVARGAYRGPAAVLIEGSELIV